jgi:hypothetical protein
MPVLIVGKIEN